MGWRQSCTSGSFVKECPDCYSSFFGFLHKEISRSFLSSQEGLMWMLICRAFFVVSHLIHVYHYFLFNTNHVLNSVSIDFSNFKLVLWLVNDNNFLCWGPGLFFAGFSDIINKYFGIYLNLKSWLIKGASCLLLAQSYCQYLVELIMQWNTELLLTLNCMEHCKYMYIDVHFSCLIVRCQVGKHGSKY